MVASWLIVCSGLGSDEDYRKNFPVNVVPNIGSEN